MAGLLSTGLGYKNKALSGFVRASALESSREQANKTLEAQGKMQKARMVGQGAGLGAMAGFSGALGGAELGAWAGPAGAVGGAALGFLFSELF